ncbi:hypothetical protein V5O48_001072 [Marasmius crinis-equi]|uniref:Protein kinase domain-containing protein n=1 Tax=Marasmius crinis-equi TaxID=585013 RepID=A0ABR3G033_9AGAR
MTPRRNVVLKGDYFCSSEEDQSMKELPLVLGHRNERIMLRVGDMRYNRRYITGLYLTSPSIPVPRESEGERIDVKYIKFEMRAADQGWASGGGHGTYRNSYTWFEASILTPISAFPAIPPFERTCPSQQLIFSKPKKARNFLRARGWDFKNKGRHLTWKVHNNITACSRLLDYEVKWIAGKKTVLPDDPGTGIGMGDGDGFLERLGPGDRVVLWARAAFDGWRIVVQEATIEIGYEVEAGRLDDGDSRFIMQKQDTHGTYATPYIPRVDSLSIRTVDDIWMLLRSGEPSVFSRLSESQASRAVDLLYNELRISGPRRTKHAIAGPLQSLIKKYRIIPSPIFVKNVELEGPHTSTGEETLNIYRGTDGTRRLCLKVLRFQDGEQNGDDVSRLFKEPLLWMKLGHRNILPFLGLNVELFPRTLCLVSPWMENGPILSYLAKNPDHDRLAIMLEIAAGMKYLHSCQVLHGNIKAANVLVDGTGQCLLTDLSLAVDFSGTVMSDARGDVAKESLRWMAPEMFRDQSQENPSILDIRELSQDVYAYGCTLFEIITGEPPFAHLSDDAVTSLILKNRRPERPLIHWCPDNVWSLVVACWTMESRLRPRAAAIDLFLTTLRDLRDEGEPWGDEPIMDAFREARNLYSREADYDREDSGEDLDDSEELEEPEELEVVEEEESIETATSADRAYETSAPESLDNIRLYLLIALFVVLVAVQKQSYSVLVYTTFTLRLLAIRCKVPVPQGSLPFVPGRDELETTSLGQAPSDRQRRSGINRLPDTEFPDN